MPRRLVLSAVVLFLFASIALAAGKAAILVPAPARPGCNVPPRPGCNSPAAPVCPTNLPNGCNLPNGGKHSQKYPPRYSCYPYYPYAVGGFYGGGFYDPGYTYPTPPDNGYAPNAYPPPAEAPPTQAIQPPPPPPPPEYAPKPRPNIAEITVEVPEEADVFIEGVKMKQPGTRRVFVSPPLVHGMLYGYEIRASWIENGKKVSETRHLSVTAGDRPALLFFSRPPSPDKPATIAKK